jgi:hypothetical protein
MSVASLAAQLEVTGAVWSEWSCHLSLAILFQLVIVRIVFGQELCCLFDGWSVENLVPLDTAGALLC